MAGCVCARPASPARGHGTRNSIETRVETFILLMRRRRSLISKLRCWWIIWLFQYLWAAATWQRAVIIYKTACAYVRSLFVNTRRYICAQINSQMEHEIRGGVEWNGNEPLCVVIVFWFFFRNKLLLLILMSIKDAALTNTFFNWLWKTNCFILRIKHIYFFLHIF